MSAFWAGREHGPVLHDDGALEDHDFSARSLDDELAIAFGATLENIRLRVGHYSRPSTFTNKKSPGKRLDLKSVTRTDLINALNSGLR